MILDEILAYRKIQLENEKERISPDELENLLMQTSRTPKDFAKALKKDHLTVIAEVKKASPSIGVIQPDFHRCAKLPPISGQERKPSAA